MDLQNELAVPSNRVHLALQTREKREASENCRLEQSICARAEFAAQTASAGRGATAPGVREQQQPRKTGIPERVYSRFMTIPRAQMQKKAREKKEAHRVDHSLQRIDEHGRSRPLFATCERAEITRENHPMHE